MSRAGVFEWLEVGRTTVGDDLAIRPTVSKQKLFSESSGSVQVIKCRRMRWAGNVARICGEEGYIQGFGGEN